MKINIREMADRENPTQEGTERLSLQIPTNPEIAPTIENAIKSSIKRHESYWYGPLLVVSLAMRTQNSPVTNKMQLQPPALEASGGISGSFTSGSTGISDASPLR
jgi:hypothetical protein